VDLEKYRLLFVDEASDYLEEMVRALEELESRSCDDVSMEALDTLFRMAHSMKSMAASLDYDSVSSLSHALEEWLSWVRRNGVLPADGATLVHDVICTLQQMLEEIDAHGANPEAREGLAEELRHALQLPTDTPIAPGSARTAPPMAPPLPRSVRVRTRDVDQFLFTVGELVQRQVRLETLHAASPFWERQRELGDELDGMAHVVRELRRRVLDIRSTPMGRVLDRLPHVAQELARPLGKRVNVQLCGQETEVDRGLVDRLNDPLLHLIRNAVDHGIETPQERERAGKDPTGQIRIQASSGEGRLFVSLEEDGRGIDVEAVRRRVVEMGRLRAEVAEDLSQERICDLIFEPGISTRQEVTAVSGRGVGLDAVKRSVEALGGTIRVESRTGAATKFEIELSSRAALRRALVVDVGPGRVALPTGPIEAVLSIDEGQVERTGTEAFFIWKEEPIPLLDLAERMGLPIPLTNSRSNVLVIEMRGFRLALRVDRALADLELFVREVPPLFEEILLLDGTAILPDGEPVFLIELGVLVEDFL